jgi:tetratricopeptide (TPR) repeat protein
VRLIALVLLLAALPTSSAQAQPSSAGQAYYEFLLGRHLESQNDLDGALAALERARALDSRSAEIRAEIAGFYARQNKGEEAVAAAEEALKLDPNNNEAHRILGLVYAAWADGIVPAPNGRSQASLRTAAIEHLSKILDTPTVATDVNLQLTLGRLQLRAGRAAEAVPILEGIVSQAPFAAEPYALLAEAQIALGKLDRAAEALAMAAEINPRYYISLGELHERQRRWADAAAAYEQAVKGVRSPSRDLHLRLAGALLSIPAGGGAARARDVLKEFLKSSPQDVQAWYLLSAANRQIGDRTAAEDAAKKILALDPKSLTGLFALVEVRLDQHDYRGVIEAAKPFSDDLAVRAKNHESEAALLLMRVGAAHQQFGEHDAAIDALSRAHDLDPDNAAVEASLVQAHLAARRFDRASELARDALARHPGDTRLLRLRSQALVAQGKSSEGLKILEDALTGTPENRELVIALADLYSDQKQFEQAVRVIETASSRLGDDDTLTMQLGSVFEEAGRLADAERQFRRLLERDPLNAIALNYLGYMLADNGQRLPEALELIQRALEIDPDNPAYLDSLGWALFKQGRIKEAEEPLRRAADTLRDSSVIQEHFGDVLAALGRYQEAAAAWQRALAGDGDVIDRSAIEKKIKSAQNRRR